ncbi:hypothetical protein HDU76_003852, partial [Blyttiomyces sp. JEL0837]
DNSRYTVIVIDSSVASDMILLALLSEEGLNGHINYSFYTDFSKPGIMFKVLD